VPASPATAEAAPADEALAASTRGGDDGPDLVVVSLVAVATAVLAGWLVLELRRRRT
jgi:hypothetical protein